MFSSSLSRVALSLAYALALACLPHPIQAETGDQDRLAALARLNEVRRGNGAPPLAWNPLLAAAAQAHSEDMAAAGFVDTTGSDGASPADRIALAGYAAWTSQRVWAESVYAGRGNVDQVLAFLLSDAEQRGIVLSTRLREVGIGIASDQARNYWTLTFGAQPNLLPVFINEDAPVTNSRQVAVLLTQEEAVPEGEQNAIGRVVEVRLSDRPDFAGAAWQSWERLIPYTLPAQPGRHTIHVEMRDGAGRTTIAADSITYDPTAPSAARPLAPEGDALPTPESDPQAGVRAAIERSIATRPPLPTALPTSSEPPAAAVVVTVRPTPAPTDPAPTASLTPTPARPARPLGVPAEDGLLVTTALLGYLVLQLGMVVYALLRQR